MVYRIVTMSTEFIVAREKLEDFLPLLGTKVTEDGHLQDIDSGEILSDQNDEEITVDELGYVGYGSVEPVRDDFSEIVSHLSDREIPEE